MEELDKTRSSWQLLSYSARLWHKQGKFTTLASTSRYVLLELGWLWGSPALFAFYCSGRTSENSSIKEVMEREESEGGRKWGMKYKLIYRIRHTKIWLKWHIKHYSFSQWKVFSKKCENVQEESNSRSITRLIYRTLHLPWTVPCQLDLFTYESINILLQISRNILKWKDSFIYHVEINQRLLSLKTFYFHFASFKYHSNRQ